LRTGPAEPHELAGRHDRLDAGHPRAGHAVLEGVRPARVRRDVAADQRRLGRARVRRVEQPVLERQARDVGRPYAGLDLHAPQQRVERAHAPQPVQAEHDGVGGLRHRPARVPRPTAARHDRHAALVAPGHDRGDLLGVARPYDAGRRAAHARGRTGVLELGRPTAR
jgi:hypothetical protein